MKKTTRFSVADGVVCSLCFVLFSEFYFSVYAQRIDTAATLLVIGTVMLTVFAILCAVLLAIGLRRLQSRGAMVRYCLVSLLVRVLCIGLCFVNLLTLRIKLFPVGDFHDVHGIFYLFLIIAYLTVSGILRLGVLAACLIGCPEKR